MVTIDPIVQEGVKNTSKLDTNIISCSLSFLNGISDTRAICLMWKSFQRDAVRGYLERPLRRGGAEGFDQEH